ncbi:MAG: bifunctional phosphoribosyl-AMP cyclohydrolase/phosphoribosyl-ATP diphosphatase HisIE [Chloroflexi bacterium]|nr:bifunctional phosphoribosyl-AMP cyclohydrolase/phosphoribosyl-ATP diphosphatase HisIE [Chloroflexota bacterium]
MLKFDERGLIPAVVQHAETGAVLMVAYMDREALTKTFATGDVWFYSRSRRELWHKGETSGHYLRFRSLTTDCDGDTLLVQALPTGPACHTGAPSCFFQAVGPEQAQAEAAGPAVSAPVGQSVVEELFGVIEQRKRDLPEGSYTAKLFQRGIDRIVQKVIEEAGETAIAGKNPEQERVVSEMADLWYHCLVLLAARGLRPEDIWAELARRRG